MIEMTAAIAGMTMRNKTLGSWVDPAVMKMTMSTQASRHTTSCRIHMTMAKVALKVVVFWPAFHFYALYMELIK